MQNEQLCSWGYMVNFQRRVKNQVGVSFPSMGNPSHQIPTHQHVYSFVFLFLERLVLSGLVEDLGRLGGLEASASALMD